MIKTPGIALYNQDRLSDVEFLANFVARHEQAGALLNSLRLISKDGTNEHQILVGTRGMGKTSLLRRIAIGIEQDEGLKKHFIPLRFREEQYNIISLDGFWRNCGESLAEWCEQNDNQTLADRLDIAIETPEWRDDETAKSAFLAYCEEAGGRAVLLLDNLDLILEGIKDQGCWSLRATLQQNKGPIVIGAATAMLAQSANRKAPFYEFFHPHILEPLTEHELLRCLNAIALHRDKRGARVRRTLAKEPERVRALYVLTGGNPRILALIYGLLEQPDSSEIFSDLEALLDQVTPYYKARIEEHQTPQQRAIIDGVSLNWDPITIKDLSKQTGIPSTTLSGQMNRLKKDGLVEEVATSGSSAGFQLAERFLNIWYLMRHGTRKTKQRLRWFTIFLSKLFSLDELRQMAGDAQNGIDKRWHPDRSQAVVEAYEIKRRNEVSNNQSDANALLADAEKLWNSGQHQHTIAVYDQIVQLFGQSDDLHLPLHVATALVNKGVRLANLERYEEANAACDEVIERYGRSNDLGLQVRVAKALVGKGDRLIKLGNLDEAVHAYEEVFLKYGSSDKFALQEWVASALEAKASSYANSKKYDNAIYTLDEIISRYSASDQIILKIKVDIALNNRGFYLEKIGRIDDSIIAFKEVISRRSDSDSDMEKRQRAYAGVRIGDLFHNYNQSEYSIKAYDDVINNYIDSKDLQVQLYVADSVKNRANLLSTLSRYDEALEFHIRMINKLKKLDSKEIGVAISGLYFSIGWMQFCYLNDTDGAEKSFRNAIFYDNDDIPSKANLCWVLLAKSQINEAKDIFYCLKDFTGSGRHLWQAGIEIVEENFGSSVIELGKVLERGLEDDNFEYFEALLWYLRISAERGYGERMIDWFVESGNSERYAPVYGAFIAHVRGERFLLDLNPEVRGIARLIFGKLSASKKQLAVKIKNRSRKKEQ